MLRLFATELNQVCNFQNLVIKLINTPIISQKRYLKEPSYPELNEEDIREIFAKGSGPGGQKLNKATNRCQLKHIPTGIIVTSHHTRSLQENRKIARKLLQQKLDLYFNKESSYLSQLAKLKQEEKLVKTKRSVENLKKKKNLKKKRALNKKMLNPKNSEECSENRKKHACSVICPSMEYLEKSEIITNVKCTVEKCDEVFSQISALNFHLEKVHKIFKKVEKDEIFCTRAMSKSQKVKEKCECKYHCPKYGCKYYNGARSLPTFHSLKNHFIRMHGIKSFKCSKCLKEFSIKSEMERHESSCGQLFVCDQCNISYSSLAALHKHVKKKNHAQNDKINKDNSNKIKISKTPSTYGKSPIQPVFILPNNVLNAQLILLPNSDNHSLTTSEYISTQETGSQTIDQANQSCGIQFDASIDLLQNIEDFESKIDDEKEEIKDKNGELNQGNDDYDYLDAATSTSPFIDFELFFNNSSTQTQPGYFTNTCSIQTNNLEENQSVYFCSDFENVPDYMYCNNENSRFLNKTCQTNRCDTPVGHLDSVYGSVTQTESNYLYDYQIQTINNSNTQSIQTQTYHKDLNIIPGSNVVQTQTDFCFN